MKLIKALSLFLIPILSCSQSSLTKSKIYCFNTVSYVSLYSENKNEFTNIEEIFNRYDRFSDNYQPRGITNLYTINDNNGEYQLEEDFYDLLKKSFSVKGMGANNYSPLLGSLSKKWKESLQNNEVLSQNVILEELEKINTTQVEFLENNMIRKTGEAELDLGGIVKGYVIDKTYEYLTSKNIKHYLVNAGESSILVGKKKTNNGYFNIGLKDVPNAYLKLKDTFISTSGVSNQGKTIEGVTYSHIINPVTGSAINNYDAVIVISDIGYLGDALSTSMMMNTLEEIKTIESNLNIQTIVVRNNKIIYKSEGLKVYYH